ncbi:MAG: winged helix-turn-helix transcriptional regulator [Acidobacteria bacterium]|nr:winged helix-turn-helix transcriptional regulator [Acidobacteriota bacterium]
MASHFQMTGESLGLVANRFKVLSEPIRLRLLQALERGEVSVGALADRLGTTQPNVSKHLKMLQEAGLVGRRQEGNTVWYAIADPSVFALCDLVCGSLRERLEAQAGMFRDAGTPPKRRR